MANPFVCTNMVWHSELNFDGAAEQVSLDTSEDSRLFLNLGQFVLEESAPGTDSLLWGGQGGPGHKFADVLDATVAIAFYNYQNVDELSGEDELADRTVGAGNSGTADSGAGDANLLLN
jgi:hypothetical protein